MDDRTVRFVCDAMCVGLARWLRALGYEAACPSDLDDHHLVAYARDEDRVLVSSDSRMFERKLLRDGAVKSLFLPRGLRLIDQVRYVVERFALAVREPRCMACGGELVTVGRDEVGDRVPARSLVFATEFFECAACRRVFWNGTHWNRIRAVREAAATWAGRPPPSELRP